MASMVDKSNAEKTPFNSDIEMNRAPNEVLVEGAGFDSGNDFRNYQNSQSSFTLCYKILAVLSFIMSLFSMIGVIYLFLHQNQCEYTNTITTPSVSVYMETNDTTLIPTHSPTTTSSSPSTSPSSPAPTHSPTATPSTSPSSPAPTLPPLYRAEIYVGDYKVSVQNKSHDNWLLCNGSFLDPREYPELFEVIGYLFGSKTSNDEYFKSGTDYHLLTRFALPNAKDHVIGIDGNKYNIGDDIGKDSMVLNIDNIPSHSHEMSTTQFYLSYDYSIEPTYHASTWDNSIHKNVLNSSDVGNGVSFELYQPTIFVGNLFIYAGNQQAVI